MNRRGLLAGILAAGFAPAIVKAGSLMPIWVPPKQIWHSGGILKKSYAIDEQSILHRGELIVRDENLDIYCKGLILIFSQSLGVDKDELLKPIA